MRTALLPLVLVFAFACSRPATVPELLADAKRYEAKGDFAAAIVQLKNVLRQEPRNAQARYLLGAAFLRTGDAPSAEKQLREALDAKHDAAAVLPLLAQALFQQGEFRKLLEATRASDYGDIAAGADILSLRGHAQLSLGNAEDAAASFAEALKKQPEHPQALLGEARLQIQRREAAAALALVERSLAADGRSVDGWLMKGDLERSLNRIDAATASYRKALEINARSIPANFNLASVAVAFGRLDEARRYVDAIRESAPESPVGNYLLGIIEFRSGNFAKARQLAEKILKVLPDYLPALALSAAASYSLGDDARVEKEARAVLERQLTSVYMRRLLGATLLRAGKPQEALDVLLPAAKIAPHDVGVLTLIGRAYYEKGEVARAKGHFELAAKKLPDDAGVRTGLGLTRLASGEVERALADLESAVGSGDAKAEMLLVTSLVSMRKIDQASAIVERLEKARRDDPEVLNLKGAVLLAKRNAAEARRLFSRALELKPGYLPAAVNLAQLDVREGKPEVARQRYEKILEREQGNAEAMIALATLVASTGTSEQAIQWLLRAKTLQPQSFPVSMALSRQYLRAGDFPRAETTAREALAAQSESAQALDILGQAQLKQGKNAEARTTYTRLASLYPKAPDAQYALSGALVATGNTAAAELALKKALELKPDFPEALASLAALQMQASRFADALATAEQIKAAHPKISLGYAIEGDIQVADRKYERAVRAYERAHELQQTPVLLMKLHNAMRSAKRVKEADALLVDWLERHPHDSRIRLYYADAGIKAGDFALAAAQYELERRRQPANLLILHNLVWCYERLNDVPRALEAAEAAYKINSDRVFVLDDLARMLIKGQTDPQRAIKLLEKALTIAPESQSVRYHLAQAYLQAGEKGRARIALEQLVRGRRSFPEEADATALLKTLQR